MDVTLVNPFVEGALHILDTTAFVKVKPDPPFLKKDTLPQGEISGILKISGDVNGSAVIGFSENCILGIVSAMFGEDMTEINEEIIDAVGEISNMIAGHVTTKIAELGNRVKVKFVRVCAGADQEIAHIPDGGPVLVLPFRTTNGKMVIEVCYAP
jgi:chemotaxis protein CheX